MNYKIKIVLVNLGSPKSTSVSDVRSYLKEFLGDPRVVDINPLLWKIILNCFVLPFRPKRSAQAYSRIWTDKGFPLIFHTEELAKQISIHIKKSTKPNQIEVNHAHLLASPRVPELLDEWEKDLERREGAKEVLVVPLFPQYSESTIAAGVDGLAASFKDRVFIPTFRVINSFHLSKVFIDHSVQNILDYMASVEAETGHALEDLVISFHGIPKRRVTIKKDPYYRHCFETYYLIINNARLKTELASTKTHMVFQSRFGQEEWLTPYCDEYVVNLVHSGSKSIGVYCPSFITDCLETIDEIGEELKEEVEEASKEVYKDKKNQVHYGLIPCLNSQDEWSRDFAHFCQMEALGSYEEKRDLYYNESDIDYSEMPEVKMKDKALSPKAKKTIKIVFLTLFLDLIGFSIIFPLFPALAKHYLEVDSDNFFLRFIFDSVTSLTGSDGSLNHKSLVLFGGALGALYSFLQFLAAPLWGTISDRIGRKKVLMISVFFLALSYLIWGFAGSFSLVVLARFIGGIMGGNISTATAAVADVTSSENRSKGMAFVGIAFALGFIMGPAIGGILSTIDLTSYNPSWMEWGINPFSMPAFFAFALSLLNFYLITKKFEETLNVAHSSESSDQADQADQAEKTKELKSKGHKNFRSANPFKLLTKLPFPGVNLTNWGNFLFLLAFSGMEFTLTFLAFERFSFSSLQNAYMFIFIGFILILVQGGIVRRYAFKIGEKKMALIGLALLIPGLLSIGFGHSIIWLYVGLFFLALGSGMLTPCLSALVSLYTPETDQGLSIGVFRSLGALARVIGPLLASVIYFDFGSSAPYLFGTIFLILPLVLLSFLPRREVSN